MTVVCSDKTGTLTMNEMTVKAVILADHCYRVEGESYEPVGNIYQEGSDQKADLDANANLKTFITAVNLCNDSQIQKNDQGHWIITGSQRKER